MRAVKMFFLAGLWALFTSASTFAIPLDITFTGGAPQHFWGSEAGPGIGGTSFIQFEDVAYIANISGSQSGLSQGEVNLAGVNSLNFTWQAPAGYMYVVNPPPSDLGTLDLQFEAAYLPGPGQQPAVSLGGVTASSLKVNTIYGTSPLTGSVSLDNPQVPATLLIDAGAPIDANTKPFAFNSITISANFSGTGAPGTVQDSSGQDGISGFFGLLFGVSGQIQAPNPGPLFTLEPLPSASAPDETSTLTMAGIGFVGLLLAELRLHKREEGMGGLYENG